MSEVVVLDRPDAIAAATHPVRARILDSMRSPATAAAIARTLGQSRQNIAYHVRELEKAGLVRQVGERRNGNFIEKAYVAAADTFVLSPACTWGAVEARTAALADQSSLGQLHAVGARLQRDSAVLLDRAAFDGEEIPSASATTEVRFDSEQGRAAFLRDYVDTVTALARRHGSRRGTAYRVLLAAYPAIEQP